MSAYDLTARPRYNPPIPSCPKGFTGHIKYRHGWAKWHTACICHQLPKSTQYFMYPFSRFITAQFHRNYLHYRPLALPITHSSNHCNFWTGKWMSPPLHPFHKSWYNGPTWHLKILHGSLGHSLRTFTTLRTRSVFRQGVLIAFQPCNQLCRYHVPMLTKGPHARLHALTRGLHTRTTTSDAVSVVEC